MRLFTPVILQAIYKIFFCLVFFCVVSSASALQPPKYAVYSGSFDPPTLAHKAVIESILMDKSIERLYVVVNRYTSKTFKGSLQQRVKMVEMMFEDEPAKSERLIVIVQDSPNKMTDYLVIKKILRSPLMLVTGQDSYVKSLNIPEELRVKFDAIAVIPRGEDSSIDKNKLEENVKVLNIDKKYIHVSSSLVRQMIDENRFDEIPLDPKVVAYIKRIKLYRPLGDPDERKHDFETGFYTYIGRLVKDIKPPTFVQTSSRQSWPDQYYKYFWDNNLYENACFRSPDNTPSSEGDSTSVVNH